MKTQKKKSSRTVKFRNKVSRIFVLMIKTSCYFVKDQESIAVDDELYGTACSRRVCVCVCVYAYVRVCVFVCMQACHTFVFGGHFLPFALFYSRSHPPPFPAAMMGQLFRLTGLCFPAQLVPRPASAPPLLLSSALMTQCQTGRVC